MKRVLILVFLISTGFAMNAQPEKIQSGIFYYFTNYISWPSDKGSGDFIISVVGKDPIVTHLKAMASTKRVSGRKIVIREVGSFSSGASSHIIFLANSKLGEIKAAADFARKNNILLVTDSPGYARRGAGINFVLVNGKPGYEINSAEVRSCGLNPSTKLLSLGKEVK